jgi:hypothetical protein
MYLVLDMLVIVFYTKTHLILTMILEDDIIITISILQMTKLRLNE